MAIQWPSNWSRTFVTLTLHVFIVYRRDYARAIQLQPTCLPARVNLGFTLQVCFACMYVHKCYCWMFLQLSV